jgi:hypothetical protein
MVDCWQPWTSVGLMIRQLPEDSQALACDTNTQISSYSCSRDSSGICAYTYALISLITKLPAVIVACFKRHWSSCTIPLFYQLCRYSNHYVVSLVRYLQREVNVLSAVLNVVKWQRALWTGRTPLAWLSTWCYVRPFHIAALLMSVFPADSHYEPSCVGCEQLSLSDDSLWATLCNLLVYRGHFITLNTRSGSSLIAGVE